MNETFESLAILSSIPEEALLSVARDAISSAEKLVAALPFNKIATPKYILADCVMKELGTLDPFNLKVLLTTIACTDLIEKGMTTPQAVAAGYWLFLIEYSKAIGSATII